MKFNLTEVNTIVHCLELALKSYKKSIKELRAESVFCGILKEQIIETEALLNKIKNFEL